MLKISENADVLDAARNGRLEPFLRDAYRGRERRKRVAVRRISAPSLPAPEITPVQSPVQISVQRLNFLLCFAVVCGWHGHYSKTETIKREICQKYGVTMREIRPSGLRGHGIVQARHEAFWRMGKETKLSLVDIGRLFGGFDHTSVLYGQRLYEKVRSPLIVGRPLAEAFAKFYPKWDLSKMILGAGNIKTEIEGSSNG